MVLGLPRACSGTLRPLAVRNALALAAARPACLPGRLGRPGRQGCKMIAPANGFAACGSGAGPARAPGAKIQDFGENPVPAKTSFYKVKGTGHFEREGRRPPIYTGLSAGPGRPSALPFKMSGPSHPVELLSSPRKGKNRVRPAGENFSLPARTISLACLGPSLV